MAESTLYLCEKPSQARDIARVLGANQKTRHYLKGNDTVVTWCYGHLLEMAPPDAYDDAYQQWSMDTLPILPEEWRLNVRSQAKAQYNAIAKLLGQCPRVVVATDADREGETIGREILDRCRYQGDIARLWLSALDDASIRAALAQMRDGRQTLPLYHAGLGRARADWLVGMNLTRAYTMAARNAGHDQLLSVGRVQTPTLRLVVDRDRAIERFKPQPYWQLRVTFITEAGDAIPAEWRASPDVADEQGRCIREHAARQMAQRLDGATGTVANVETKRERKAPPLPYDLGTLQQDANRAADLSAQQVLDAAQALYETHKATTYPRTDCRFLPISQHAEATNVLRAVRVDADSERLVVGADPERRSKAWNDAKITAHHAIIPTVSQADTTAMSAAEHAVYTMIRNRYIAQFYPDHEADKTVISIDAAGGAFRARGRQVIADGWRAVEPTGSNKADDGRLPAVRRGDTLTVADTQVEAKQTEPPARYTEGTLIGAMKNAASLVTDTRLKRIMRDTAGLGTEATRAGIVETLQKRGFLGRQKQKHLVSSEAGRALIDALPDGVSNPETTALWEQALDDVAGGNLSLADFIARQTQWVEAALSQVQSQGLNLPRSMASKQNTKTCPECGRPMRKRKSQHGAFWGCSGYPDCTATVQIGGRSGRTQRSSNSATPKRGH